MPPAKLLIDPGIDAVPLSKGSIIQF